MNKRLKNTIRGEMKTNLCTIFEHVTVKEALMMIQEYGRNNSHIADVFLIDKKGILTGIVPLRKLLISNNHKQLSDISEDEFVCVFWNTNRVDMLDLFMELQVNSLPVVTKKKQLIGIIHYKDIA